MYSTLHVPRMTALKCPLCEWRGRGSQNIFISATKRGGSRLPVSMLHFVLQDAHQLPQLVKRSGMPQQKNIFAWSEKGGSWRFFFHSEATVWKKYKLLVAYDFRHWKAHWWRYMEDIWTEIRMTLMQLDGDLKELLKKAMDDIFTSALHLIVFKNF